MSDPKITEEEVRKVATLARLALGDDEIGAMRSQLDAILGYTAELDSLDVSEVDPTFHSIPIDTPLRPDKVDRCTPRREALAAAPATEAGGFSVPRVLELDG